MAKLIVPRGTWIKQGFGNPFKGNLYNMNDFKEGKADEWAWRTE